MRERWRRPLTLMQLGLFAGVVSWLGYNIYTTVVPLGEWLDSNSLRGAGQQFFFDVARWHALAWVPGGVLLAAPMLAAERERGHLTDWVLAGLSPRGIVHAKFRALAGFVMVMVCVPFPVFALCFALGGVSLLDFFAAGALTIAIALNSVAFGAMISASARTVTGALGAGLAASAGLMLLAVPLLGWLLSGPWVASLTLAVIFAFFPLMWIAIAAETFEGEVEQHVKGDPHLRLDTTPVRALDETQRWLVDRHGQLVPPPPARPQTAPAHDAGGTIRDTGSTIHGAGRPIHGAGVTIRDAGGTIRDAGDTIHGAGSTIHGAGDTIRDAGGTILNAGVPTSDGRAGNYTEAEALMLRLARDNAITQRDLRRRFHQRHANVSEFSEAPMVLWNWGVIWVFAGVVGWILNAQMPGLLLLLGYLVLVPAMGYAALGAAPGFTRERAQKMLSALQMTALSPRDIVGGKVAGVLLGCAHWFGGPLLALTIMALQVGPWSAAATLLFGVTCVVFTAIGSLTLSLWSRKTEIVALGGLAAIAGLWWVLPVLYINNNFSLIFHAPLWLERVVAGADSRDFGAARRLRFGRARCFSCRRCARRARSLLGWLCVRQLRRTRAEEEATGLLQRDLSRGWH